MPTKNGAITLFRLWGITVRMHWSWFLVAYWQIQRSSEYRSPTWAAIEYLALFLIVLMHEFGHATACRQVGGKADEIILWPLGGVAYVAPPPRAGAYLWSIAAGPLVNVVLVPITFGVKMFVFSGGFGPVSLDVARLVYDIAWINLLLLIFNMLPVYPLDGGQIVRAILWFFMGPIRSLLVSSVIGMVCSGLFLVYSLIQAETWHVVLSVFVLSRCVAGFREARAVAKFEKSPRHPEFACPSCGISPIAGEFWKCGNCGQQFDTFVTNATCPGCKTQYAQTACMSCKAMAPMSAWRRG